MNAEREAELSEKYDEQQAKASKYVTLVAMVAGLSGLLFGYDTGVIAGAQISIGNQFNLDAASLGFVVSMVTYGAVIGAVFAGWGADRFGRKHMLAFGAVVFMVGIVLEILANDAGLWIMIVGRVVLGIGVGLASVIAPMYVAEVAPARMRGGLITFFQLAVTVGILGSGIATALLRDSWGIEFAVAFAFAVPFGIMMMFMPESPRWLVKVGRFDKARDVMRRSLGSDRVAEASLTDIQESVAYEQKVKVPWTDIFGHQLRYVFAIGVFLAVFQQLTGVNAIFYYGPKILTQTGVSTGYTLSGGGAGNLLWINLIFGAVNVAATFIAIRYIDRLGRKALLTIGLIGMAASQVLIAIMFWAVGETPNPSEGWVIVALICVFIVFFAFSFGPILWVMVAELYPTRIRATAMSLTVGMNWLANAVVSQVFPIALEKIGSGGTFIAFAAFNVIALLVVIRFVPETKDRTLEQLERLLGTSQIEAIDY